MQALASAIPGWIFWGSLLVIALPTAFIVIDKTQVMVDPEYYWSDLESLLFHAPKPVAMLVLFLSLCGALWRAGASHGERSSTPTAEGTTP